MTATLNASKAILKVKYANGVPKEQYQETPFLSSITQHTDFGGDYKQVALMSERGQALANTAAEAITQASASQGQYNKFQVTRANIYAVAQITGEAIEATRGDANALANLWDVETDQCSAGLGIYTEIMLFGDGTGILGTIASGTGTPTITLNDVIDGQSADISKFSVGQKLGAVSDATLSPTVRSGSAIVTAVDRNAGTVTISGNWTSSITGVQTGDSLVRYGDAALAGVSQTFTGVEGYISGTGTTLFSLVRSSDVARLAGQTYVATGKPMLDSLVTAMAKRSQLFRTGKNVAWCNTLDLANLIKSIGGKDTYTRVNTDSKIAGISYESVQLMTSNGPMKLMDSPFIRRGHVPLLYMDSFAFEGLGAVPHILNLDSNDFLRLSNDDAYQVRFGVRGNVSCNAPAGSVTMTGWGQ